MFAERGRGDHGDTEVMRNFELGFAGFEGTGRVLLMVRRTVRCRWGSEVTEVMGRRNNKQARIIPVFMQWLNGK